MIPTAQVVIGSVGAIKKAIMSNGFDYRYLVCMVIDEADEMLRNRPFAADIMTLTKMFNGHAITNSGASFFSNIR